MTLPEITTLELTLKPLSPADSASLGQSFAFDFSQGDFLLRDGKLIPVSSYEALKVWIEKVLRTERFRFRIYARADGNEYGVAVEDLIGRHYPAEFAQAEWRREITEALTKHPQIAGVSSMTFQQDGALVTVGFHVELKGGDSLTQEVRLQ